MNQQKIGFSLPHWTSRPRPKKIVLDGHSVRLEPLNCQRHAASLYEAFAEDKEATLWTYLTCGPFTDFAHFYTFCEEHLLGDDPMAFAIVDQESNHAVGLASYLRIDPANGSIEVGGLAYSPRLKRSRGSTEAMYLMMRHAFDDLGYRRYEWKCDSFNAASEAAALRLGFTFEGTFRQALVYKGRNRDTSWFSIIDSEWPALKCAFGKWLDPANFDAEKMQKRRLQEFQHHSSSRI